MLFREVIGQRKLINKLTEIIDAGRVSHAQMFLGKEGSQKLALALAYAQYLNCTNKQYFPEGSELRADSCGICPTCKKFDLLSSPDLYFYYPNNTNDTVKKDPKSSDYFKQWIELVKATNAEFTLQDWYNKMDIGTKQGLINVRDCQEIIHNLSYKNFESNVKVVIIWMVDKLYYSAAPKLLKILEEPNPGTLFLLIAENTDNILNTILSRTQIISVPPIDDDAVAKFLQKQYNISASDATTIASVSNGDLIEAQNRLINNDDEQFNNEKFVDWMRICLKRSVFEMAEISEALATIGRERLKNFLSTAQNKIRWSMLMSYSPSQANKLPKEEKVFLTKFSPFIHHNNIQNFVAEFEKAIFHVERNANNKILLMDLSIKISMLLNTPK